MRVISLWAPVVGFMVLLFLVSAQTTVRGADLAWDKLLHAGAYATLGLLSLRALNGGLRSPQLRPALLALLLAVAYGFSDELHQAFVPGRDASVLDWVADAVGAALAVLVVALVSTARARARGVRSLEHERGG